MQPPPEPTVELYMTESPHTIGPDQPISDAFALMHAHSIRHLPVVAGEQLVGILSERDLRLFEALENIDPKTVAVRQAMTEQTYAVGPKSTVRRVAREMEDHKYGSAVVLEQGKVVGIFTAIDGLRALSLLIEQFQQAMR